MRSSTNSAVTEDMAALISHMECVTQISSKSYPLQDMPHACLETESPISDLASNISFCIPSKLNIPALTLHVSLSIN